MYLVAATGYAEPHQVLVYILARLYDDGYCWVLELFFRVSYILYHVFVYLYPCNIRCYEVLSCCHVRSDVRCVVMW